MSWTLLLSQYSGENIYNVVCHDCGELSASINLLCLDHDYMPSYNYIFNKQRILVCRRCIDNYNYHVDMDCDGIWCDKVYYGMMVYGEINIRNFIFYEKAWVSTITEQITRMENRLPNRKL